jgi:hypothetical protein
MKLLEPLTIEVLLAWKLEEEDSHRVSYRENIYPYIYITMV